MFRPYGIVGKDFVSGNNMCWNIVIVLQERLKRDHHGVSEISEVGVILHLLLENIAWIDNSRMCSTSTSLDLWYSRNHIFSEV